MNLTSDYLAAANYLKGKKKRKRIVAYVESYDDILFWRNILSPLEDETRYFEILLPNANPSKLGRGKKSAITALARNQQLGKCMIACVDADYDYLMQRKTLSSEEILSTPYVFHTYAYSIENLQCYAPGLHNVCVMATLNDHIHFDFEAFLREYSLIIYPLFVWNIWLYRRNYFGELSITEFCQHIETGKVLPATAWETLHNVQKKVQRKLIQIERHHPKDKLSYQALDKELRERLGVKPEETYLYIQGHFLFEHIMAPLVQRICTSLIRERENDIRKSAAHATQARNELSCYNSSIQDVSQMLKKSTGYMVSEQIARIQEDIRRALPAVPNPTPQEAKLAQ